MPEQPTDFEQPDLEQRINVPAQGVALGFKLGKWAVSDDGDVVLHRLYVRVPWTYYVVWTPFVVVPLLLDNA